MLGQLGIALPSVRHAHRVEDAGVGRLRRLQVGRRRRRRSGRGLADVAAIRRRHQRDRAIPAQHDRGPAHARPSLTPVSRLARDLTTRDGSVACGGTVRPNRTTGRSPRSPVRAGLSQRASNPALRSAEGAFFLTGAMGAGAGRDADQANSSAFLQLSSTLGDAQRARRSTKYESLTTGVAIVVPFLYGTSTRTRTCEPSLTYAQAPPEGRTPHPPFSTSFPQRPHRARRDR